jgi:N-acetyl-anhydromuramyl-L-alanine amidase AmpD
MGIDGPVDPRKMRPSIEDIVEHFEGVTLRKSEGSRMTDDEIRASLQQLVDNDIRVYELVTLSTDALHTMHESVVIHNDQLLINKTQLGGLHERVTSLEQSSAGKSLIILLLVATVAYLLLR